MEPPLDAPELASPSLTQHPVSVLLVDDQAIVGEAVRRMLAPERDIMFHYCQDPTRAMAMAVEVSATVILQDLVMPQCEGLELVQFYRANPPTQDIPVIVLSTKEEAVTKAEAFSVGANDYLVKLPDRVELVARIRYHSKGFSNLLQRNEAYQAMQAGLERLRVEREKSERLLLNVLPKAIAERLKQGQTNIADSYAEATVLFADICGFTSISSRLPPAEIVGMLNEIFSAFDVLATRSGLEKIKTIGDAYMLAAGIPVPRPDHAEAVAGMALGMLGEIRRFNEQSGEPLRLRIGIHSGPVAAGVVGKDKFIFDLWGDTVNIASRMESHGLPGEVHVSEATADRLRGRFELEARGEIPIKGKGPMRTFIVKRALGS